MTTNAVTGRVVEYAARYSHAAQEYLVRLAPRMVTALLVFAACWVAAKVVRAAIGRVARRGDVALQDVMELLGRVASGSLIIVGAIMALDTIGVKVNAIIAGLGLTGFAVGLATRDALTNVLSGVLIIMYRPFVRGDRVIVTGIEGTVDHVDLRYTTLRADDRIILIPNSTMLNSTVVITRRGEHASA